MTANDGPSAWVRIRVLKRDRYQCTYCGAPGTEAELEVDHIIAVANGGSHHISNLTTACRACNQAKGSDPQWRPTKRQINTAVGLFVLELTTCKQGQVVGADGDTVLVQLFSWLSGNPTNIVGVPKTDLYSDRYRLYATEALWHKAAEQLWQDASEKQWQRVIQGRGAL